MKNKSKSQWPPKEDSEHGVWHNHKPVFFTKEIKPKDDKEKFQPSVSITEYVVGFVLLMAFLFGCSTGQQATAFKTIGSMETTVTAGYDAYIAGVIKGTWRTNEVPIVSRSYNAFQQAATIAVNIAGGSTNAPPTAELVLDAANLTAAIAAAESTK